MTKNDLLDTIPEIASKDIVTFGECQISVLDHLKLSFKNRKVSEIEIYTGCSDHQTGALNELEPNLELQLDFPPPNSSLLLEGNALDQINEHFKANHMGL